MGTTFAGTDRQAAFAVTMLTELHGSGDAGQAAFDASVTAGKLSTRGQVRDAIDWLLAKRDEHRAARNLCFGLTALTFVVAALTDWNAER